MNSRCLSIESPNSFIKTCKIWQVSIKKKKRQADVCDAKSVYWLRWKKKNRWIAKECSLMLPLGRHAQEIIVMVIAIQVWAGKLPNDVRSLEAHRRLQNVQFQYLFFRPAFFKTGFQPSMVSFPIDAKCQREGAASSSWWWAPKNRKDPFDILVKLWMIPGSTSFPKMGFLR